MNREVIRIEGVNYTTTNDLPVEFLQTISDERGWTKTNVQPSFFDKVVYLGYCFLDDADLFAAYKMGSISFYKGHLNSGKY